MKAAAPETVAPDQRWQRSVDFEEAHLTPKAARRTQRVYDGVRQLHADGRISDAHLAAANPWVSDFEWCYTSSYVDPHTAEIRSSNTGPENRLNGGLDSRTRYMQSCKAVGLTGDMLLRAFVSQGKSLRALEREIRVTRKRLSDMLVETLETLALHYDEVGRWGRNGILETRKVPDDAPVTQPSAMAA